MKRYSNKKFVIDADSLKVINPIFLNKNCIITPQKKEFEKLFGLEATEKNVKDMAEKFNCIILLKGPTDIICSREDCRINITGNQGMTKGGTGDVLAGLVAALACKNDLYLSACAGAFINGLAGDRLKKKVSFYYNATDLADEIPKVLKELNKHSRPKLHD